MSADLGAGPGDRDASAFVVTGGEAFRVDTEALQGAAVALASAGETADAVAGRLEAARAAVWRGACAGSDAAASFEAAASRLVTESAQLAADVRADARSALRAAGAYADTEARTAAAAGARQRALRNAVWGAVPAFLGWSVAWPGGDGRGPVRLAAGGLRALTGAAGAVAPLTPWVPAGGPGDPISVVRTRTAPGLEDASTFGYAARSLQQAQGISALDDGSAVPPSSILVERLERPDGSTAVMLTVPGTQTWSLDDPGGGVFDAEGNLDAMAGRESHARQLIERALADQQLAAGDEVVFNVHSQGSLHVFGLLEDEAFRSRYPVAAVTVLGGVPTAFRVPDDVAVLSIANCDDAVPGLSGLPPLPRPNVVDVRTPSHPGVGGQGLVKDLVAAHDLDRYAADARALDLSGDPSVRGYAAVLGAVVGTGIAGAAVLPRRERFVYTGRDTVTPLSASGSRAPSR
ncbi:hypothetical protein GCM10012320_18900 [Sinomonas cellulolyticus]|uniref:Uncharacterized protein n=1 Tax=Sinomonas cellulolyticus TaxID=2801916 RepID=A0ABS1K735_9MICC|nr:MULTISPECIES: hypothetical protein [Sinomonas]MBL0707268.1 hypothetical protein [Sinomonas cellulolyticus]GHG50342.1 hypothetical protein GCM10012320_18900 [Sinomonas sp. KCTC 49339]